MRKNLKKLLALLLAMLMVVSLTACSSTESEGSDVPAGDEEVTFTYATGNEPAPLDPAHGSDSPTSWIVNQVWLPLYNFAEDGGLVPALATSHDVSEDGLVYTIHLRDDAKWSDGEAITAAHVEYGMKRSLGLGTADSYYSYFIGNYVKNAAAHVTNMSDVADMDDVGIKVIDDVTLEITLEKPTTFFPNLLTAGVFSPLRPDFAPEHDYTWADSVGYPTSAAFVPTEIDRASKVVMEKNEEFYDAANVTVDVLVAIPMADQNAQLVAFQTGEIDMATSPSSDVTKVYAEQPELVISNAVINYYTRFNSHEGTPNEVLQDPNIRRAIQLGVDRSAIVQALDAGDVYYELNGLVPSGIQGADGEFRSEQDEENMLVYTDKEEAKRLLAEAGYNENNPLEIEYYYNQNAMHDIVAQVYQAQLKEVNINMTLRTGEFKTVLDDIDNGLYSLARSAMSADYMDPTTFLDQALPTNQPVLSWGDDVYAQMIADANAILDPTERMVALHAAETYLIEEMSYANPLFGYNSVYLVKAGVEGIGYNPQGNGVLWFTSVPTE